jgi:transposase
MPFQRRRRLLVFSEDERRLLERLRKSRTEQKRRRVRAAILLDSVAGLSDQAIARAQRVNRNTVILCIQKCLRFGVQAALGELPRSGKPRRVSDAAIAWVQNSACQKPKELGYAQELWTYGLLTAHLRQQARAAGYPELERVSRSKLHKILMQGELRPHKVRY